LKGFSFFLYFCGKLADNTTDSTSGNTRRRRDII